MFSNKNLIGYDVLNDDNYDYDNCCLNIRIIEYEPDYEYMKNLFNHSKLFNYRLFELYNDDNKFTYYAIRTIDVTTHFNNFIKIQRIIDANYNGESNSCVIIDEMFFNQLYNLKNIGSKATILQLCLFPNDKSIIEKCKNKVGFYMVAKISINLANKCIIYPEHNISDFRIDNMFTIKSFNNYIPNICLEIDENSHSARDSNDE